MIIFDMCRPPLVPIVAGSPMGMSTKIFNASFYED